MSARGGSAARWWLPGMVTVVGFCWFGALSIGRWNDGHVANFDLGIFAQGAQSWAHGHLPVSHIRGMRLLGDHFSPILVVWGGLWWLWPDPRVLLLAQTALLTATLTLIVVVAQRRLGARVALALAVIGLLSRGVLTADLYDVHEVAFAAPAAAILCVALLRRDFRWCVIASVALVLTKEDLGLTVLAAGCCWWLLNRRQGWRKPLILMAIGILGLVVAMVVTAHFSGGGQSGYLGYFGSGGPRGMTTPADHSITPLRLLPVALFLATTMIVGCRSVLALLAVPTLLWRAVSSNEHYWSLDFHYDLVLWPIALLAFVDAVQRHGLPRPRSVVGVLAGVGVITNVALGVWEVRLKAATPTQTLTTAPVVRTIQRLAAEHVPAGARIGTQNDVGAYLVSRYDVYSLRPGTPPTVGYAMFTSDDTWAFPLPVCARDALIAKGRSTPGWQVWQEGTVTLVKFASVQVAPVTCG